MEIHFDSNQSTNSTITIYGDNASPVLGAVSLIFSAWIVISNLFILICIVKHRNTLIKSTFTLQILTLSASDFLVGISTLTVYVTSFTKNISYNLCFFRFVFTLSAQAVEQFHILGICINRLIIVGQMTSPIMISRNTGAVVIFLIINWIINLGIFSVPFGIWAKYRSTLAICSLNEIFQDDYKLYTMYATVVFVVSAFLVNAVYISIIVKLRFFSRKNTLVNSTNVKRKTNLERRQSSEFSSEDPKEMNNKCAALQTSSQRLDNVKRRSILNIKAHTKLNIKTELARQGSTGQAGREVNRMAEMGFQTIQTISNQVSPINGERDQRTSSEKENESWKKVNIVTQSHASNQPSFKRQSKALTTIGNQLYLQTLLT